MVPWYDDTLDVFDLLTISCGEAWLAEHAELLAFWCVSNSHHSVYIHIMWLPTNTKLKLLLDITCKQVFNPQNYWCNNSRYNGF